MTTVSITYDNTDTSFEKVIEALRNSDNTAYRNCLKFRDELYSLGDPLFNYVEIAFKTFRKYLLDLKTKRGAPITDLEVARILHVHTKQSFHYEQNVRGWRDPNTGWRVLAKCYVSTFPKDSTGVVVDPSALLKLIRCCDLFDKQLQLLADVILKGRHRFYGHIPQLTLREDDPLDDKLSFKDAIKSMKDLHGCLRAQTYRKIYVRNAKSRPYNFH